ncbi:hypothetical protein BSKO_05175 [Bryopsis sp. KO-2023]|nr:hypothetical protein BSKO_05175 [Bryopsis sp. KO-2023]
MEFLGKSVRKHFEGFGWFTGRVVDAVEVNGRIFGRVKYDDGDLEDLPIEKLREVVVSSTTAKKKAPSIKKKKKTAKQKKTAAAGSKQKPEKPSPAPARKQPARVVRKQTRVPHDVEEGEVETQGIEKTTSNPIGEKPQGKKNATTTSLRLLTNFWDDAPDKKVADNLNEIFPDVDDTHPWTEAVRGSEFATLRSASDRRVHPLDMSVPKGTRTERKPSLCGEQGGLPASQEEEFSIRALPTIHRRLRKSLLCVPSKGPVQMIAKPRRGRPPKTKKMEGLSKRPRGRPRKHPVCIKISSSHPPLGPSHSDTHAPTETSLPPIDQPSPSTDVPKATQGGTPASVEEGKNTTTPSCSPEKKPDEVRWGALALPECLGSNQQVRVSIEEASIRSSQNSLDGLPDATSPEKAWEGSSRSKRQKTENQPPSPSLSPLPVDTTSCQDDSMVNESAVGVQARTYEVDQRCPYASKISNLCAGMHGPVASNWRGRPGVCLPTTERTTTSCSTVSTLIQKEVVKLGERLWWKSDRGRVLSVGWATVDGILCGRCGWVVDVSGFAECVGIKMDEPGAHIWAANGMSLLDLIKDSAEGKNEEHLMAA